jgi:hypothetical protein
MRLRDWALLLSAAGTATLAYGALVEARRLVLERRTLALPHWPERLRGFRVALLADFHVQDQVSLERAQRAVAMAIDEGPDVVVIAGDFVDQWRTESPRMLGELLEPLLLMEGNVVAVPGNHDYLGDEGEILAMILDELNIKLLRNRLWHHQGIDWIGIDSFNERRAHVEEAVRDRTGAPAIAVWHEPDLVWQLPPGISLQLSGHSHGGQFRFPYGITPMTSRNGKEYLQGYYPTAPTPLYVSRGVGTTFLPSRFLCPPEVTLLTLIPKA